MIAKRGFYIFLLFIALSPNCCLGSSSRFFGSRRTFDCAVFYSAPRFNGVQSVIQNGTYNELNKTRTLRWSPKIWNNLSVGSFKVKQGCTLQMCSDSDLNGQCTWFSKDRSLLNSSEFPENIVSLSCTCKNNDCEVSTKSTSKCGTSQLDRNECGRAFFENGCNSCTREYIGFQTGRLAQIKEEYRDQIKSLIINSGCSAKIYETANLTSEIVRFSGGTFEMQNRNITSVECTCEDSASRLVSKDEVIKNVGNLTSNTTTAEDISAMIDIHGRHVGLTAALRSLRGNRSPKNAYIMLVGMPGSGKSTTIDTVFGNLRKSSHGPEFQSTSSLIHEYRVQTPVSELELGDSELRIIDTPPLGNDIESDAQVLATLDNYLENHEELRQRIPNIVLVFAQFNVNGYRLRGRSSNFQKTLGSLELLKHRLFDNQFSNVIFVLTHFMSGMKRDTRLPKRMIDNFKHAINYYSTFPKPLTFALAENKEWDDYLPIINGYLKLPNGDFYPRNLFDKIQEVCKLGDDPIGASVIGSGFSHHNLTSNAIISTGLVAMNHTKVIHYLFRLAVANICGQEESEVLKALQHVYDGWTSDMKRSFPADLHYIGRILSIRNINKFSDIPKSDLEIVKFFKGIRLSPGVTNLLSLAFNLTMPSLRIDLVVGQGYSISKDVALPNSPFMSQPGEISDIGYILPDILKCELHNDARYLFHVPESRSDYLQKTLKNLNGPMPLPGFNILDSNSSKIEFSLIREERRFQLTLNDSAKLSPEFLSSVNNLTMLNVTDDQSVAKWKGFFEIYGTHVVQSVFGGGSIEIKLTAKKNTSDVEETMSKLAQFVEDVGNGLNPNFDVSSQSGIEHSFVFHDGDQKKQTTSISRNGVRAVTSQIAAWKKSLYLKPIMLTSATSLLPISEVIKRADKEKFNDTIIAAKTIYNISFPFARPNPLPPPPPRNETFIPDLLNSYGIGISSIPKILADGLQKMRSLRAEQTEYTTATTEKLDLTDAVAENQQTRPEVQNKPVQDIKEQILSINNTEIRTSLLNQYYDTSRFILSRF